MAGRTLPRLLVGQSAGRVRGRRSVFVLLPAGPASAAHAYAVGSLQLGGVMLDPAKPPFAVASSTNLVAGDGVRPG